MHRGFLVTLVVLCFSVSVQADVTIVDDNFDGYADDAAFETVWRPDEGNGNTPTSLPVGILVPRTVAPFPPPPFDGSGDATVTPAVEPVVGQAVAFPPVSDVSNGKGYINEWDNDSDPSNVPFAISPSATQDIRLSADMFDFVNGNRRFSVGLRDDVSPSNLLELGFWNASTFDPVDPNNAPPNDPVFDQPTTAYGYRLQLWGPVGGELVRQPNWQYFPLSAEFDDPNVDHNGDGRFGDGNGLVTPIDVGPGWHRYSATISDTDITLELDLFRDGTVDSTVTWEIETTGSPFTSLRMGGPSGESMNEFTMADNVKLELIDLATVNGDFNDDQAWDCADIDALTAAIAGGSTDLSFDMNGDGSLTRADITDASVGWLAVGGANNPADTSGGNPFLEGDADLDGTVDGNDFLTWNMNKFTPLAAWCSGDWDANGMVDGADFLIWNTFKFQSSDGVSAVPEPAALSCWWLACLGLAGWRRRR